MPIYAYRCSSCGHAKDVLQRLSDPALTVCPACGAAEFSKQLTAAGFQLKGSGWYATDFKGGNSTKKADAGDGSTSTDAGSTETAKPETPKTDSDKTDVAKSGDASTSAKSSDKGGTPASTASAPKAATDGP